MANNFAGLTSLKSLHNFESGALGTDSVGDNDMTTVGGATASSDEAPNQVASSYALDVQGSDDLLYIANSNIDSGHPLANDGSGDWTAFGWVIFDSNSTQRVFMSKYSTTLGRCMMWSMYNKLGVNWGTSDGSSYNAISFSNISLTTGRWYHIQIKYDESELKLYARVWDNTAGDWIYSSTFEEQSVPNKMYRGSTAPWSFGAAAYAVGSYSWDMDGRMDEWGVCNALVSDADLEKIKNGTYGGGTTLTVADLTSSSTLDAVALTQAHSIAIAELLSSSSLDATALIQRHLLAIAELLCSSSLDAVALSQVHNIIIGALESVSTVDNVTLSQAHGLLIGDATSGSTLNGDLIITFVGAVLLVIQDLVSSSTLDAPALTQAHNISIADLTSSDTLDGDLTLSQKCYLVIQELTSSGLIDAVVLSQAATLVIQSLLSGSSIDAPVLTQAHRLTASNLESAGTIDNITLSQLHQLIIDALTSSSELDNIVFTEAMIALYILLSLAVESTSKITTGPQDTVKINATKDIQLIVH